MFNRENLEDIAGEVRTDVYSDLSRFRPPCDFSVLGECGYAAKEVSNKLQVLVPQNKIRIYYFKGHCHYVVGVGNNFEDSWKIDPTITQFGFPDDKLVFSPEDDYPLMYFEHPSGKKHVENPIIVNL